jgi:hypothetical protein
MGTDRSALDALRDMTNELMELGLGEPYIARAVREDPDWDNLIRNREGAARMWHELHDSVTAEAGSSLTRTVPNWKVSWEPMIIVAEPEEFDDDYVADDPRGWTPLAKAHCREAGWDASPRHEEGTWIGWWEPLASLGAGEATSVSGLLTAFIVVGADGTLRFAHTVTRRRRTGIASKLVRHARAHHGLHGPLTEDGRAFASAAGLLDPRDPESTHDGDGAFL